MKDYSTLAARQQGVVTRGQLHALGLSKDAILRRIGKGALVPLHPGVYAIAGVPDSFARRITAAVLAAGEGAVVSHRAAATLLELGDVPARVEISVPAALRPRLDGVTVHRVTRMPDWHTVTKALLRVTSPARTLCDLAGVLSAAELEVTLDHPRGRRRLRFSEVVRTLDSLPRNTRGAGTLRALLAARPDGRARTESPLEQALHALLRRFRVRGWERQVEAAGCRIDVAFVPEKLALQVDSYLHHSSRSDWALDHRRHSDLVAAGWRVLPVTKEDIESGAQLVERIRRARVASRVPAQIT